MRVILNLPGYMVSIDPSRVVPHLQAHGWTMVRESPTGSLWSEKHGGRVWIPADFEWVPMNSGLSRAVIDMARYEVRLMLDVLADLDPKPV